MADPNRRRSDRRYSVPKIASYRYEGKSFLTLTMDLGLGGMKIKTPRELAEGEQLDFKLDHRFLFIISIDQVCVTDGDLIHFVFPLEDHRHMINLGDVLKDPLLEFRFRTDPNVP